MHATATSSGTTLFNVATSASTTGTWTSWEGTSGNTMLPFNEWVFLSLAIDSTTNTQYGFRYDPSSSYTISSYFSSLNVNPATLYSITPATYVYWGGDTNSYICNCAIQYVRFYIDYAASSQDEMINLALMNPDSRLYYLFFETNTNVNNNQTMIVNNFTNTTSGTSVSVNGLSQSDTTWDAVAGPYNVLNCRPGSYVSFSTGESNKNGIVVAMDVKFYSGSTGTQNIFAIRNGASNFITLTVDLLPNTQINIAQQKSSGTWFTVLTSTAVTLNTWNRLIFELVQVEPTELQRDIALEDFGSMEWQLLALTSAISLQAIIFSDKQPVLLWSSAVGN
eukprot:CAMPEP_0176438462 /NCGR_PEP_ID=MMETSP0127-20121128/19299_1 /TAXON_ID=938130 /ORGANISM="Platyophrya macrostoma, Strain WH" /LENGTH=335 /DNA_ID=CAMNT_0017822419 /DNA_START=247 /DNA_END=1255 /DNA_ORIENTATION=+